MQCEDAATRVELSGRLEKAVKAAVTQLTLCTLLAGAMTSRMVLAGAQEKAQPPSTAKINQSSPSQNLADQDVREGIRLAAQAKLSAAAQLFVEALRFDPQNAEAHYNLGLVRMKWGDMAAASSSFREVLRIDPGHAAAQHRLASILTQLARDDQTYIPQAIAAYTRAIELDPTQPEAYFNLGYLAAVRKGDYRSAITDYEKTLALDPHYPQAHLDLGISLYQAGEFEKADPMLQAAVSEEPNSAEAHHYCGLVLGKRGEWDRAVTELRAAVRLAPDNQEIHYVLAEALRKSGHVEEAKAELAIVQSMHGSSTDQRQAGFRDYQARKSIEAGELDGAIDNYRQSLALAKDARTATNLGVALLWNGNPDGAIQALQRALEIDPNYEWADYYLGVSLARKHEFEKAEEALDNALKLRPEFPEAEFYRGLVYAGQGRFQQAEPDLYAAVHSRPDAAATHYYLGSVLMRLGKEKEGESELEISRRLDPGFKPGQSMNPLGSSDGDQPTSGRTSPQ
jgi:tetratricopeptide (TPR) repeat protein